jgi:hypothetical protein
MLDLRDLRAALVTNVPSTTCFDCSLSCMLTFIPHLFFYFQACIVRSNKVLASETAYEGKALQLVVF